MRDFIKTLFRTSEERIKNPIVGTFVISWLLFNWRPIFIVLFSKKTIEYKLIYVQLFYSDYPYLILGPLISIVIYVLGLPYITLGIEWLLKTSVKERAKIQSQKKIQEFELEIKESIQRIKLDRSKTEELEASSVNSTIENQEKQIRLLQTELSSTQKMIEEERIKSVEQIAKFNTEQNKKYKVMQEAYSNAINGINEYEVIVDNLNTEVAKLKNEIDVYKINTDKESKILYMLGSSNLLQYTVNGSFLYFDITNKKPITSQEFREKVDATSSYKMIELPHLA